MVNKQEFEQVRPMLEALAAGIAGQFGPDCEVVVHDLTHGLENTIAIIHNGHVTGRKVGDSASETVLAAFKDKSIQDRHGYISNSKAGKMLKCSTTNIRNAAGEVIAVFCVNYDIGKFVMAGRAIEEFLAVDVSNQTESIPSDVNELLEQLIEESRRLAGKPVAEMSKEEKVEALRYLDKKGALLIKKSSERIAEYYGISKFTLYNYLGEEEK
jgi:predicted transcriptional regulator YheO